MTRSLVLDGKNPRTIADVVRRLFREEAAGDLAVVLVSYMSRYGGFSASRWRELTDSRSRWDSVREALVDVGLIYKAAGTYFFSPRLKDELATCAVILNHAILLRPSPSPVQGPVIRKMGECESVTLGVIDDSTCSPNQPPTSRGDEGPDSTCSPNLAQNGAGDVFERLARSRGIRPEAARKMCEDDVRREGLDITPTDLAKLYLGGI